MLRLSKSAALPVGANIGMSRDVAAAGFLAEIGGQPCELNGVLETLATKARPRNVEGKQVKNQIPCDSNSVLSLTTHH
jgi:hypothetical protein